MRALAIEKIIEIASYLKIWNNFHGLSTVVGALVGPAISRLKDCFDMIPSSYLKKMQKYEQYLNPQNNFQKYRKKIQNIKLPALPMVNVIMRDLIHFKEIPSFVAPK